MIFYIVFMIVCCILVIDFVDVFLFELVCCEVLVWEIYKILCDVGFFYFVNYGVVFLLVEQQFDWVWCFFVLFQVSKLVIDMWYFLFGYGYECMGVQVFDEGLFVDLKEGFQFGFDIVFDYLYV